MPQREKYITLGQDMKVLRLGFGAMHLCGKSAWGPVADLGRAYKVLQCAQEIGVSFMDTADAYGPGESEALLRSALHPFENLVVGTKGGMLRSGPRRWTHDVRPEHLVHACEDSLTRLGVERIDLYQLHAPDLEEGVPIEDSIGALNRLQQEGKIRHIGICNVNLPQLVRARSEARIVSVQNHLNLYHRKSLDVLHACEKSGIAFIAYRPLAAGALPRDPVLLALAKKHCARPAQVALAWLLHLSPNLLPIPGTHSVAHLKQNMGAQALRLDQEDMRRLAALARSG